MGTSTLVKNDVFLGYNSTSHQIFAAWVDSNTGALYFNIFNGSSWQSAGTIPVGTGSTANNVFLSYDPAHTQMIATWNDTNKKQPYYSVYTTLWSTGAGIPLGASTRTTSGIKIFSAYNPSNSSVIATWSDGSTNKPYYSVWNGSLWTAGATISATNQVSPNSGIYMAYDSNSNTIFATWGAASSKAPTYSIYSGGGWSSPSAIPITPYQGAYTNVTLSYDTSSNKVVATWAQHPPLPIPTYSIFNGSNWTKSAFFPSATTTGATTTEVSSVSLAYNANNHQVVGAWTDSSFIPIYSIYDGSNWSTGTPIPLGSTTYSYGIVLAYDLVSGTVFSAWGDLYTRVPYYSTYNGTTWANKAAIPPGVSNGVKSIVSMGFKENTNQMFAAWSDTITNLPYYSIYNGLSWSTAATIPKGLSNGVAYDVTLAYNENTGQIFAAWADSLTNLPYYSIYKGSSWSTATLIPYGSSNGVYNDISLAYNPNTFQMFATWADSNDIPNYFSTFSSTWETAAILPPGNSNGTGYPLPLVYDESNQLMYCLWTSGLTIDSTYFSYSAFSTTNNGNGVSTGGSESSGNGLQSYTQKTKSRSGNGTSQNVQ